MKHKWAAEIHAWADGAKIQCRKVHLGQWEEKINIEWEEEDNLVWNHIGYEFRIKPAAIKYRVALLRSQGCSYTRTCNSEGEAIITVNHPDFVKWLDDDWQEAEI